MGTPVEAALGTDDPERLSEVTSALDLLARHLMGTART